MAISYIGSAISDSGTIDLTGISMQPDDIVIIISGEDAGAPALASGYTSIATTSSTGDIRYMYKIMPNPVDSSATGLTNASDCGHLAMVFRGVDTSSPINTFQTSAGISGDPDSPSITTTVGGAMIVSMGFLDDDLISTPTPPSGFTLGSFNTFGSSGAGGSVMGAYFTQTNAGAINPGVWNTSGSDWWGAISIALNPEPITYIGNYTATYSKDYNLSYIATALTGKFKVWSGSSWQVKPVKVWNGSFWEVKPVKRWNGSAWININVADLELTYVADGSSYNKGYVAGFGGTTYTSTYLGNSPTYSKDYVSAFGGAIYTAQYGPAYTGLARYNLTYTRDYNSITYSGSYVKP